MREPFHLIGLLVVATLLPGCHTFEVRQSDSIKQGGVKLDRAAVVMNQQGGDRNKLFAEQLIVSLQKRGIDVAERQKVEALLVDAEMIKQGMADMSETERAQRLGRLLKADVIIYGDAIVRSSHYRYFNKLLFNSKSERYELEKVANEQGIVKREGYPVLASHAIGLSMRAVDTATGEIVWVGYHFLSTAKWVEDHQPETLTNFDVVRGTCDHVIDDLLTIRKR